MRENTTTEDDQPLVSPAVWWAIFGFFSLPIVILLGLVFYESASTDGFSWRGKLMVAALALFLLGDPLRDGLRNKVGNSALIRGRLSSVLTPARLTRVFKDLFFAPVLAFCFIDTDAAGSAALWQWLYGLVLSLVIIIVVNEVLAGLRRAWATSRSRPGD